MYAKIAVLQGRNAWECHAELHHEALGDCTIPYQTFSWWEHAFIGGCGSAFDMHYGRHSVSNSNVSVAIMEQYVDKTGTGLRRN